MTAAYLSRAIMEIVERHGERGASMGVIVDHLAGEGFDDKSVEAEVWALLGARRLTPSGFVCRKVRRRDETGEFETVRTYEFLLVPWSPHLDQQLDLLASEEPAR